MGFEVGRSVGAPGGAQQELGWAGLELGQAGLELGSWLRGTEQLSNVERSWAVEHRSNSLELQKLTFPKKVRFQKHIVCTREFQKLTFSKKSVFGTVEESHRTGGSKTAF